MTRSGAHAYLYERCGPLHARLDSHAVLGRLLQPGLDLAGYAAVLSTLHGPLASAESRVLEYEARCPADPAAPYVARSTILAMELKALGYPVPQPATGLAPVQDFAACLGYRYVLEGAALGSRHLLQALCRRSPALATGSLDYLQAQSRCAESWPLFVAALNRSLGRQPDWQRAGDAACTLFSHFCRYFDLAWKLNDDHTSR